MHVLLVARFDSPRSPHAPFALRALERLGCTVTPANLERTGWLDRLTRRDVTARLEQAIRQARPDLVLVTDGEVMEQGALASLRGLTPGPWACWVGWNEDLEDPARVGLEPGDLLFAAGERRAARWSELLGRPVHRLEAACDPSVHRPLRVREPFRANLVFAGTATPYREQVLVGLVEFGLAIWGRGWKKTSLREYCLGEQLSMENYVRACAGASVAVNLRRNGEGAEGAPLPARLFELAAIGVPQVVDNAGGLGDYFDRETEVLAGGKGGELHDLVREALADAKLRERVALAARQAALQRHTYMHRFRDLLTAARRYPL